MAQASQVEVWSVGEDDCGLQQPILSPRCMEDKEIVRQRVLKSALEQVSALQHGGNDSCVICLEWISERAIACPCRHGFDFLCLVSWLEERATCPLCNGDVRAVEYHLQPSGAHKVYTVPREKPEPAKSLTSNSSHNAQARAQGRTYHPTWELLRPHPSQPPVSANTALLRRKHIYQQNLYSSHVGSNRLSKYREFTPSIIARDEGLVSRARKWIRRELKVFEFLNSDGGQEYGVAAKRANNAEFLMEYIIAILKTVDIKGAGGQAEDMLQEFLGRDNTRLFLHELRGWLRSPYDYVEDWDRHVQYGGPVGACDEHTERRHPREGQILRPLRRWSRESSAHKRKARHMKPTVDHYSPHRNRGRQGTTDSHCGRTADG